MKKFTLLALLSLFYSTAYSQLPLQDFEGTWTTLPGFGLGEGAAGPAGWYIKNVAGPAKTWVQQTNSTTYPPYLGDAAAFLEKENVPAGTLSEDWLITPQFNIPQNAQLRFFSRLGINGNQGSTYDVRIGTDPADASTFTSLIDSDGWTELEINPVQLDYTEKILDIPAGYEGQQLYIAFIMKGDNYDSWLIDNVSVLSECVAPTNLMAGGITNTTANLSWNNPGGATTWEVAVLEASQGFGGNGTEYSGTLPYLANNLTDNTNYKFYVRALCDDGGVSEWAGPFNFSTNSPGAVCESAITIGSLPYTATDNTSNYGDDYNGSAGSSGCGSTQNYLGGDDVVYAYTATEDGAISINLTNTGTYAGVFVYNSCSDIGVSCIEGGVNSFSATPISIPVLGVTEGMTYYFVISTWPAPQSTAYTLTINDLSCPPPTNLSANSITSDSATVTWTGNGATSWEVIVQQESLGAPTGSGTLVTTNSYIATPLDPSTDYEFYVRAVCGADGNSSWSGPYAFVTSIGNDDCSGATTLTVNPDEDCLVSTAIDYVAATASATAPCSGTNGPDIWYNFLATSTYHGINLYFDRLDYPETGTQAQPIVISLYEGDNCGNLDLIDCSTINVLNANGLTPGTMYTVRLTINSASPNLNADFNICINTLNGPSNQNQDECIITTINSDFEQPGATGNQYPKMINHNIVQGWRTTASDQIMEFWPTPNYENVPSYSGSQFIELNANLVSGVYQDYDTPVTGTVFNYSFAHRGRQGTDTCQLLAGPPGGPYLPVGNPVSTGNTAWSFNTGTYTVPAGQPVTRFIFQSVSSSSPQQSVGNFLDAITFTANNGIITQSPLPLDCSDTVASVAANGAGEWIAHVDNPSATVIADATSNTTTISGFTVPGSYYFDWTTDYCTSTLEIVFEGGDVDAPVVSNVTYCQDSPATALTAQALPGHELHWFADAAGTTPLPGAPTPDTSVPGVTTYYVNQTFVSCQSEIVAIDVTVYPTPDAPLTDDVEYCANSTATPLTATALANHTLNWYTAASGGTALATAPTPDTNTPGTTVYYVSQTSAEGCESDRASIQVTVNPVITPVTTFTLPSSICNAQPTLMPGKPGDFTTGGTFTTNDNNLIFNSNTGLIDLEASAPGQYTFTYTINADADNCIEASTTSVTFTILPSTQPVTGFTYTDSFCEGSGNQLPVTNANFTANGAYTSTTGLDINSTTGEINTANSTPGQYVITYSYTGDAANCIASGSSTYTINILPVVTPVTEFNFADSYCFGDGNAIPSWANGFTTGGTFTATNGLMIDAATGEVNIAATPAGIYSVTYTVEADQANCNIGGFYTDTFTIGGDLSFTLDGNCEGSAYIITATSPNDFNEPAITFEWTTVQGMVVGNDTPTFNVTDYVASGNSITFPAQFILTVYGADCESSVLYEVTDISCSIQRGISPNGDGANDDFDLTSLEVSKLSIFNRYGKEVYTKSNYTTEWHGQAASGDELPSGTYFYVIERNSGENKTGWIYINRQEN